MLLYGGAGWGGAGRGVCLGFSNGWLKLKFAGGSREEEGLGEVWVCSLCAPKAALMWKVEVEAPFSRVWQWGVGGRRGEVTVPLGEGTEESAAGDKITRSAEGDVCVTVCLSVWGAC